MTASPVFYRMRRLTSNWLKHIHDRDLHSGVYTVKAGSYTLQVPAIQNPSGGYASSSVTGTEIPTGTVMGQITVSKKLVPCVYGASDGSQTPIGFVFDGVDAAADVEAVIVEGFCSVVAQELVWDVSFDTQLKKDAALALLAPKWVKNAAAV